MALVYSQNCASHYNLILENSVLSLTGFFTSRKHCSAVASLQGLHTVQREAAGVSTPQ